MNYFKELLLGGYYSATLPARRKAAEKRAALKMEPIRVLFYHRIADDHPNGWTMSRATFKRQIDWIADHYDVISLDEAQLRIMSGQNRWPAVAITFDDGYADNCDYAVPLLLAKKLPFTYFVATNHVLNDQPFEHDVKNGVPLAPNTVEQIRSFAAAGVEIGAHTRSHADLGSITTEEQLREEVIGSKQDIETIIGKEVGFFAFPFGLHKNLSQDAFRLAYQEGFRGVCSAYGAYNWPGDDHFHIRRIHADPEMVRLKNWLTIDPRKTSPRNFDPGDYDLSHCEQTAIPAVPVGAAD